MDRQSVEVTIDRYSSRLYDALQLSKYQISSDQKVQRPCGDGGIYGLNHFWHMDGVSLQQIVPAVARLRAYLLNAGWDVSTSDLELGVVSANNPKDRYVVWAKGIGDLNRIAVQVSSPCLKVVETDP